MAWITYEPDRIVHLPSNSQITMRSYKIAWNDDKDKHGMVVDHNYGDKVYNWENENDRLRLRKENTNYPWWCRDDPEEEYEEYLDEMEVLNEEAEAKEKWARQRNEEKEECARRYLVLVRRSRDDSASELRRSRLEKRFNQDYHRNGWLGFDNLTIYFAITFSDGRPDGKRKLLFISADRQAFEIAKRGLQLGLGAVRLDELELKGNPSGCKGQIYNAVWDDVLN